MFRAINDYQRATNTKSALVLRFWTGTLMMAVYGPKHVFMFEQRK